MSAIIETPYRRAKQVWDKRLARYAISADIWRKLCFMSFGLIFILFVLLLISLSWHKPKLYVAEVSSAGQIMNVKLLSQQYDPTQAQEEYFITQFIQLIRNLPLDPVAAKNNWLGAYAYLSDRGAQQLNEFFKENNPLSDLSKKTITVSISDINPLSKNSYQADWLEQSVDQNGQIIAQKEMSGTFTITVRAPTDKEAMLSNPLGIYIIDFHISPKFNGASNTNSGE